MRKLWLNIKIFFESLAWGMRGGDKLLTASNKENEGGDIAGIEQQKEAHNVYADLLRGEVTQEVKELRHEMYYSERKSHDYVYAGGGHAVKKNQVFDYNGNIETSDGFKVQIVQENKEDASSLIENGIYNMGTNAEFDERAKGDLRLKEKRNFTIEIKRDFFPSFRLEQYATKIVVKRIDDSHVILDIYVSADRRQFDNVHKLFLKSIEKIYMGDKRSDIVDFNELNFITSNAYGSDDLKYYSYDNIKFDNIISFDGSYVLRFTADIAEDGYDLINDFFDAIADEKSKKHTPRNNATEISLKNIIDTQNIENYDVDKAKNLMDELNNEGK